MADAQQTTDHDTIKQWIEQRNGQPATVEGTGDDPAGVLRVDFDYDGQAENLEPISWEDFFEKFESDNLAFLYQDETDDGDMSRFYKFVRREGE